MFGDNLAVGPGGNDTLWGGEGNDTIHGGAGNDQILGDNDNDFLSCGTGADTISGSGGVDTIEGGAGSDLLAGGATAGDTLSYANSTAGVRIALIFGDTSLGIGGEVGDDALFGGKNNDLLHGSRGQDTLTGGNGADRFVFDKPNDSTVDLAQRDTITDFSSVEGDRIDLGQMDAQTRVPGNQVFVLVDRFSGTKGELRFRQDGDDLLVLGDVNGDRQADFAILVQGVTSLGATDFVL